MGKLAAWELTARFSSLLPSLATVGPADARTSRPAGAESSQAGAIIPPTERRRRRLIWGGLLALITLLGLARFLHYVPFEAASYAAWMGIFGGTLGLVSKLRGASGLVLRHLALLSERRQHSPAWTGSPEP